MARDDFTKPLVMRFFYGCTVTDKEVSSFRDYSAMCFVAIFDDPVLPACSQFLTVEGMKQRAIDTATKICKIYGSSPFGKKAAAVNERLNQGPPAPQPFRLRPIHHPREFLCFCVSVDRFFKGLKPDPSHISFASEVSARIGSVDIPDLTTIGQAKQAALTSIARAITVESVIVTLIFDNHPVHFFGAMTLFVRTLELLNRLGARQGCFKIANRDPAFLPTITLRLAKSELLMAMRLLVRLVHILTNDTPDTNIMKNLSSVLRELLDWRTFLRISQAFIRSDGFMKWLKQNQAIAGPWTERAVQLSSSCPDFVATIAFVAFWATLGSHSIQVLRMVKFAQISLSRDENKTLVLNALRRIYQTSSHYSANITWQPDWGSQKPVPVAWPLDSCMREITGLVHSAE
jgi:hypothetical protein